MKTQKAFANLKKAWVVILCLCLASIINAGQVRAQTYDNQKLIYDVYAGGFHVVQADLDIKFPKEDRYALKLSARTFGFLGNLVPWEGSFESAGWITKNANVPYAPELHRSNATWRGETNTKHYNYNRDGTFRSLIIDEHDKDPEDKTPDQELTNGTTDALTAALNVLYTAAQGQECAGAQDIFDGKRRFTQMFKHKSDVEMEPSRYNIYGGPAQVCEVEIKPVSGAWNKKPRGWLSIQEQGREQGALPTVWIGTLEDSGMAVPVKILVKTKYGSLVMHLAEHKSGTSIKTSEKREER